MEITQNTFCLQMRLSALIEINCCSLNQYKKIDPVWLMSETQGYYFKTFQISHACAEGKKIQMTEMSLNYEHTHISSCLQRADTDFMCCVRCLNPTYLSHIFSLSSILLKARRNLWWSLLCICLYSQQRSTGNPCQRACMACWHQRLTDTDVLACHHLKGLAQL